MTIGITCGGDSISTYEGASDSVIVEGILQDERLVETYRISRDKHPPGDVHHMIIRMEIKGPKLMIEEIEVEIGNHDTLLNQLRNS